MMHKELDKSWEDRGPERTIHFVRPIIKEEKENGGMYSYSNDVFEKDKTGREQSKYVDEDKDKSKGNIYFIS